MLSECVGAVACFQMEFFCYYFIDAYLLSVFVCTLLRIIGFIAYIGRGCIVMRAILYNWRTGWKSDDDADENDTCHRRPHGSGCRVMGGLNVKRARIRLKRPRHRPRPLPHPPAKNPSNLLGPSFAMPRGVLDGGG